MRSHRELNCTMLGGVEAAYRSAGVVILARMARTKQAAVGVTLYVILH